MRLLIIRHGESLADILNVHEGRADFELTEKGLDQAKRMAAWVAQRYRLDSILTSPLKRARQTAERLASQLGLPFNMDELLMEFNNGLVAGLPREEAEARYPYVPDTPLHEARYGQESRLDFRHRADILLSKVLSSHAKDTTIALISHGGFIKELYHAFLGLPVASPIIFFTGDTGIHEWQANGKNRCVLMANSLCHLADG